MWRAFRNATLDQSNNERFSASKCRATRRRYMLLQQQTANVAHVDGSDSPPPFMRTLHAEMLRKRSGDLPSPGVAIYHGRFLWGRIPCEHGSERLS